MARNLIATIKGQPLPASYDGYASCPLTAARDKILRRVRHTMQPAPSIPFIDTTRERTDRGYFKRYALPALYRNLMLRGRA